MTYTHDNLLFDKMIETPTLAVDLIDFLDTRKDFKPTAENLMHFLHSGILARGNMSDGQGSLSEKQISDFVKAANAIYNRVDIDSSDFTSTIPYAGYRFAEDKKTIVPAMSKISMLLIAISAVSFGSGLSVIISKIIKKHMEIAETLNIDIGMIHSAYKNFLDTIAQTNDEIDYVLHTEINDFILAMYKHGVAKTIYVAEPVDKKKSVEQAKAKK